MAAACESALAAATAARKNFVFRTPEQERLDSLSRLQESLSRLVEIIADDPENLSRTLRQQWPKLVPAVIDLLNTNLRKESQASGTFTEAFDRIDALVWRIINLRYSERYIVAPK